VAQIACPVCDERYFDDTSGRRQHTVRHDEWLQGVRLRRVDRFERVGAAGTVDILLVRPSSPESIRLRAERVSRRAVREPLEEGGYDKPLYYANGVDSPPELRAHVLLLASAGRCVGTLVLEVRPVDGYYVWGPDRSRVDLASVLNDEPRWSVVHVWVLASMRKRGLARVLIDSAVRGVGQPADTLGWMSPYSNAGFGLMKRVTVRGFHRAVTDLPMSNQLPSPFSSP
jgi:hypothetical protein